MKRYMLGLMGLVLAGVSPLMAQGPAPGAPVVAVAPGGCCAAPGGCCTAPSGHCCARDYTCVPQQYTKKKVIVEYSSTCEPFCLCFFHGCQRRCDCESGHCEHPYSRHFLIKKVHTCEECATKCVPSQCGTGCCGATAGCCAAAGPATPAPVMAAPAQAMPMAPVQPTR